MVASVVFGQLLEVVAQRAQQRCAAVGVVRLHQSHDLVVDHQTVGAVTVPVNAAQIDVQTSVRQRLGQQPQQALAIDRLACGAQCPLLRQPNQKTAIDQGHAGAAALIRRTVVVPGAGRKIIAFHSSTCKK